MILRHVGYSYMRNLFMHRLIEQLINRNLPILRHLIAGGVLLCFSVSVYAVNVELTDAEKQWLIDHPHITMAMVPSWQPISMRDAHGQLSGLAGDYKSILEQRLGIRLELAEEWPWKTVLEKARNKEVDVLLPTARTPDRETYLNFTNALFSLPYVIITQANHAVVDDENDLIGKKTSVARSFVSHEWLIKNHPDIPLVVKDDTLKALEAVASGEAEAYIGDIASASYFIQTYGISSLKVAGRTSFTNTIRVGVRKDWPELIGILNKGIATIDIQENQAIWRKWVGLESFGIDPRTVYFIVGVLVFAIVSLLLFANRKLRGANRALTDLMALRGQELKKIEYMAYYDVLTDLPNRVLLSKRLEKELQQASEKQLLAVCYLDLDGFKPVNDLYGHDQGDLLLVELSKRMRLLIQQDDCMARIGGDEFVLLLAHNVSIDAVSTKVLQLMRALEEPFLLQNNMVKLTASVGIAIYPYDLVDADTLLRHADQAMYQAKKAGRNRYEIFDTAADQRWQAQTKLLHDVQQALRSDEFCLFYQPKVDMRTGSVVGVEALIRWQHPQQGFLAPGQFLPIIEQTDIMPNIDLWVLNAALKQASIWAEKNLFIHVSVNISAQSLSNVIFSQQLTALLSRYAQVNPKTISLEILESSAIADMDTVNKTIKDCLMTGVSFALDDFGTGYSSLTYLRRLSTDTIKIDQSFVRNMLDSSEDLAIVQGVIALAKAFHLTVIAEGVETEAHGKILLKLGCDLAQGYGIARPMPASDIPEWIIAYQPSDYRVQDK